MQHCICPVISTYTHCTVDRWLGWRAEVIQNQLEEEKNENWNKMRAEENRYNNQRLLAESPYENGKCILTKM